MFTHQPWRDCNFLFEYYWALFFCAIATMSPDKKINKRWYVLAISGPVIVLVAMLPFIFMISLAEKLALATPSTRDPELWKIAIFTCLFATLVFISFTALFLIMTLRIHSSHRKQLMERYSEIETSSLDWFRVVLLIWGGCLVDVCR